MSYSINAKTLAAAVRVAHAAKQSMIDGKPVGWEHINDACEVQVYMESILRCMHVPIESGPVIPTESA